MTSPKVSIIIPVFNVKDYLSDCLDSVLAQTFKDLEIICVDDGSTDGSREILQSYAKKYKHLKVITQPKNQGVVSARDTGLKAARGDYIGWVDSDDFIDSTMVEKLYKLAIAGDADVAICDYDFYPRNNGLKQRWFHPYTGKVDWEFVSINTIWVNKLVKKELLESIRIYDLLQEFGEGVYSIVLLNATKIVSLEERLYNYRLGHKSLSSSFDNVLWYKKTVERNLKQYDYIVRNNYSLYWQTFFKYIYLKYVLILMIVAARNNDKKTFIESRKIIKKEKLFSKKYREYLRKGYSGLALFFLEHIGCNSFFALKNASRVVLGGKK